MRSSTHVKLPWKIVRSLTAEGASLQMGKKGEGNKHKKDASQHRFVKIHRVAYKKNNTRTIVKVLAQNECAQAGAHVESWYGK